MDELRAAESIRYLANQYANMVFVAECLEKIGSLEAQIKSLTLRHTETDRSLTEITVRLQAEQKRAEDERLAHEEATKQLVADYAETCHALDQELIERQVAHNLQIEARVKEAEAEAQKARDAHQTHMVELNNHLLALGTRISEATAEAVSAEARRDRAQEAVNKLQASIASIKIEGVE